MIKLSLKRFEWFPKTKTLKSKLSDIPELISGSPILNDYTGKPLVQTESEILVQSHVTNKIMVFVYNNVVATEGEEGCYVKFLPKDSDNVDGFAGDLADNSLVEQLIIHRDLKKPKNGVESRKCLKKKNHGVIIWF